MARTTEAEVIEIMEGYTAASSTVTPFLVTANVLVTKVFSGDSAIGSTLKEEIEKWLTAHMISCTIHRTTSEEKVGDASAKYTGYWGKNLEATSYGQMVKLLDTTGKMSRMGKVAASMYAVKDTD